MLHEDEQRELEGLERRMAELKSASGGKENRYMIPGAVVIAGILIGGAIMYSNGNAPRSAAPADIAGAVGQNAPAPSAPPASNGTENVRPVGSDDHILGSPDALVKVIEYSDTECPFCKRFHFTMKQIMDEYGSDGRVAWVYRHFPLTQLHLKAFREAEATECAAALGGNEAFWQYVNRLMDITPSNDGLDPAELPNIAEFIGLDRDTFETCLASGRYGDIINNDAQNAVTAGGRGTPYSIVIAPNGQKLVISGAQPYETVKQIIEQAIALQ